jgi:CHASE2 domain-containing sensor protein
MKSGYTLAILCAVLVVVIAAVAASSFVTGQTLFGIVGLVVAVLLLVATGAQLRKARRP